MGKTQRCIVCTNNGQRKDLEENEVCPACGRCSEHCDAPHVLDFAVDAQVQGRPHPDAGKRVVSNYFRKADA